ncbi:hypothetical protein MJN51_33585, partial [Salmonella enterica subsp. enterica serovar Kentucky]|nr:hypothetical protein [Salmonella enterica subsp. enterica serovar Kentucky]
MQHSDALQMPSPAGQRLRTQCHQGQDVQWYSSKTGKPVIVNPDIKGNVTVFNADVNPTNIDDFFKSVL